MAAPNKAHDRLEKALDRLERAVARVAEKHRQAAAGDALLRKNVTLVRNRLDAAMGELRRALED